MRQVALESPATHARNSSRTSGGPHPLPQRRRWARLRRTSLPRASAAACGTSVAPTQSAPCCKMCMQSAHQRVEVALNPEVARHGNCDAKTELLPAALECLSSARPSSAAAAGKTSRGRQRHGADASGAQVATQDGSKKFLGGTSHPGETGGAAGSSSSDGTCDVVAGRPPPPSPARTWAAVHIWQRLTPAWKSCKCCSQPSVRWNRQLHSTLSVR